MSTTEAIMEQVRTLPESAKQEILDFVEFLTLRRRRPTPRQDDAQWSEYSLESAMRGMEDEEPLYSLTDLKERFR